MNYIYDIVLNFQDNYYQFFEWNKQDKVKNISKIPIYRVTDQDILNFKYNQIKVDAPFLNQVKEDNKKHKKIMCLISNNKMTLGLLLAPDGTLEKRSSLLFEEEEEANEYSQSLPITTIKYKENIKVIPKDQLRVEHEKKDTLIEYITTTQDILTLQYLYYEYYEEESDDITKIKNDLLKELNKSWNKKQSNLYTIITLLTHNKLLTK